MKNDAILRLKLPGEQITQMASLSDADLANLMGRFMYMFTTTKEAWDTLNEARRECRKIVKEVENDSNSNS